MLVRMTIGITGARNGQPWPAAGGAIDVPDQEAADLIAAGYAEAIDAADPVQPDASSQGDGGSAAAPKRGRRPNASNAV